MSEPTCPFCGRDPFHYVDNGVGMEAVAVTCCELGNLYFRGARAAPEEIDLSWEEFSEIGQRLLSTSTALRGMREALETFSKAFVAARERYAKRYEDAELGRANFDAMPDSWLMESLTFNMGAFRKALLALSPKGEG